MKNLFGTFALVGLICTHVVFAQNGDKIFKTATAKQHQQPTTTTTTHTN
jgi:hypothetical protein